MSHSTTAQLQRSPSISFKPLFIIRDFFALLSAAWAEAKDMEQKSHKFSGNW
jgi:hypothetical protein